MLSHSYLSSPARLRSFHSVVLLQILLGSEPQLVGLLTSQPVRTANLKLILSTAMGGHQPLKSFGILLPREPCLDLGNIDAQAISDARGANAMT